MPQNQTRGNAKDQGKITDPISYELRSVIQKSMLNIDNHSPPSTDILGLFPAAAGRPQVKSRLRKICHQTIDIG